MLTDEANKRIELGQQIGSPGGEGAVFEVIGRPEMVAKRYHHPLSKARFEKLRAQTLFVDSSVRKVAAWPLQLLMEAGTTVGFLMERVQGRQIHLLYRPVDRRELFPAVTWQHLVGVAQNIAAGFHILHTRGILMADVNETNLLITSKGEVRFIDCDSFQIAQNGRTFPCEVGVAMWTPPELQGKAFGTILRSKEHDSFGLAVMIFHVLFMGKHPFASVPNSQYLLENPPPIEECIRKRQFPYTLRATVDCKIPPFSLPLASLPQSLADLFERAFLTETRPTPAEWYRELASMEFQKCQWGHTYYRRLPDCPWCAIWNNGGPNFFIALGTIDTTGTSINEIERLYAEIDRASLSRLEDASSQIASVGFLVPTRVVLAALRIDVVPGVPFPKIGTTSPLYYIGFCVIALAVLFLFLKPAAFLLWAIFVAGGVNWILKGKINPAFNKEIEKRKANAEQLYAAISAHYATMSTEDSRDLRVFEATKQDFVQDIRQKQADMHAAFNTEKSRLKAEVDVLLREYRDIPNRREKMRNERRERMQREDFLRVCRIAGVRIPHIGPARKAILSQYGIATAWDVKTMRYIPRLGQGDSQLKAWLSRIEARFKFKPDLALPAAGEQEVTRDIQKLEKGMLDRLRVLKHQWNSLKMEADPSRLQQKRASRVADHLAHLEVLRKERMAGRTLRDGELKRLLKEFSRAKASLELCPPKLPEAN